MKNIIQIIMILYNLNLLSHEKIKFLKPDKTSYTYLTPDILDENNISKVPFGKYEKDFYNIEKSKLDTSKDYRIYLNDPKYIKIEKKINFKNNGTLIIQLQYNPNCNCKVFSKDVFVNKCPYHHFGSYIATETRSLDEIPVVLSEKIKKYLYNRVGSKFYNKMYFKQTQIPDSITANKYLSGSEKMKTRFHYYLCFAYSNVKKGVGEYILNFEIDEDGNVLKDIDFPKNSPNMNSLVSLKKMKQKAVNQKFYIKEKTKVELSYDQEKNVLIWKFINEEYKSDGIYIQKELIFNAHNGKYLELKKFNGQWID